jgi:hypothetical protein
LIQNGGLRYHGKCEQSNPGVVSFLTELDHGGGPRRDGSFSFFLFLSQVDFLVS